MNEKIAVSDILADLHSAITMCTYAIQHANNKKFRDTLVQARNKYEDLEWDLYLIAKQKQYYVPAAPAGQADIEQVKQAISK